MIGGFLGAGKTTAIARLARRFTDQGKQVGIVTNDQAEGLVDTQFFQRQGFQVGEVAGACFCCKFDALTETIDRLAGTVTPEIILTEPVGSCTDLIATVVEPLRALHADRFDIGPLSVLLKPEHGFKILGDQKRAGFSPKAQYIFLKQLEEADVIAMNKVDALEPSRCDELTYLLKSRFPDKPILLVSARTGKGFDELERLAIDLTPTHRQIMDVDYDVYAQGEAELGWLNATVEITGAEFSLDSIVLEMVTRLAKQLVSDQMEAAHVKVLVETAESQAMANLVSSETPPELSFASHATATHGNLTINARVAGSPESLEAKVRAAIAAIGQAYELKTEFKSMARFRPAPPTPTHRVTDLDS